jgi:hypothetical protein
MESQRVKLTKKNFMLFPEGAVVESNILSGGKPVYAAEILPFDQRESQWKEIKTCGVDGRLCNVWPAEDYPGTNKEPLAQFTSALDIAKRIKLTKKELMGLPDGSLLISNSFNESLEPRHSFSVVNAAEREAQWQELKKQKLPGQKLVVFDNENQKNEYINQFVQMAKEAIAK